MAVATFFVLGIDKLTSAGQRIILWIATVMAMTPLGNGLGWFAAAHPSEEYAHSDVLQAVAELGVGAILFLAIPVVLMFRSRGNNAERAAFVAVCVEAIVSFPLHLPASGFLAALLAGYLAGRSADLCVGAPVGGSDDCKSVRWKPAFGRGTFIGVGWGGGTIPFRSASAFSAALCERAG